MSTRIMAACWPLEIPPTQKFVLIALADNANDAGFCWPSIDTICERTSFGRTAVIAAIRWLEQGGYLVANRTNGRKTTYTITVGDQSARRTGEQAPTSPPAVPVNRSDQSARRTGTPDEPVRQTNGTSTRGGPVPVREADSNRHITVKEPSKEKPARAARKSGSPIAFTTFLADCQASGEKPISDYKPVLDYAHRVGVPVEFLNLCWDEFKRRHSAGGAQAAKRQKDWRRTFLNCVEGNWYKLWFAKADGSFELTTPGVQAKSFHGHREAA